MQIRNHRLHTHKDEHDCALAAPDFVRVAEGNSDLIEYTACTSCDNWMVALHNRSADHLEHNSSVSLMLPAMSIARGTDLLP